MNIELPTIESIKRFVQAGEGVALLPLMTVKEELDRGVLKEVIITEFKKIKITRNIFLAYRKHDTLAHVPKAFLRLLQSGKKSKIENAR